MFFLIALINKQVVMMGPSNRCSLHYFLYGVQIFVVCVAISTSIFKLFSTEKDPQFWVAILSSCIGYILPNPTPKCECISSENQSSTRSEDVIEWHKETWFFPLKKHEVKLETFFSCRLTVIISKQKKIFFEKKDTESFPVYKQLVT